MATDVTLGLRWGGVAAPGSPEAKEIVERVKQIMAKKTRKPTPITLAGSRKEKE